MAGDPAGLFDDLLARLPDRAAADLERARPPVPLPLGTAAVSECTTRTDSKGTPSVPATIWAQAVS
jgi:hypothetical protein